MLEFDYLSISMFILDENCVNHMLPFRPISLIFHLHGLEVVYCSCFPNCQHVSRATNLLLSRMNFHVAGGSPLRARSMM